MAEASRDLAQGTIEVKVAEMVSQRKRMDAREVEESLQKMEESEEHIQELLDRGAISNEEARKLRTRGKMHQQEADESKPKISSKVLAAADHKTNEQMIEEALKGTRRFWLVEWFRKAFRIEKIQDAIARENRRRMSPDFVHRFPFIRAMVKSGMSFELVTFSMVTANGLLTGIQISAQPTPALAGFTTTTPADADATDGVLQFYGALEEFFNIFFIIEIMLRVTADGWVWFFQKGNASDIVLIIVTGILPSYILPIFNIDSGELRIAQVLRCVRLVRILKSVRTIPMFRILWSLVSGIVDSGRILLWTLTIITVVLYMFAIFFVQLLGEEGGLSLTESQQAMVDIDFSTVPEAMFALFQCLTLDSWTGFSRELQIDQPMVGILWLMYVAVACMVLNNLVIAVIVKNAFDSAEKDEELQASIARESTEGELNDLRTLFDDLVREGQEGRPKLFREDYERGLKIPDHPLWTKLKIFHLEEDEIRNLWEFVGFKDEVHGQPAGPDRDEFASKIRNLKGECKAKHSYTVAMNLKKLDVRLKQARENLDKHQKLCQETKKEAEQAQRELSKCIAELRQFMILTYRCIPSNPMVMKKEKIEKLSDEITGKIGNMLRDTSLLDYPYERVPLPEAPDGWALPGEIIEPASPTSPASPNKTLKQPPTSTMKHPPPTATIKNT